MLANIRKKLRYFRDGYFGPLPAPEKWIFIVGCYNSGTTLLHRILASHPEVGSMPNEGQFYTDQLRLPKANGLPRLWALQPELFVMGEHNEGKVNVRKLKRQWGARYNDLTRPVLLEKSPTNAARTHWLQKHFEQAHFIGIIRNGYAVAEGIRRKAGHNLEAAALQWARSNEIMLRDFSDLQRKKVVRYEEMTEHPEECLRGIMKFIGVDPEEFQLGDRSWHIHEKVSEVKNMNYQSFERLNDGDCAVIKREAGQMLDQLNYNNEVV